MQKEVVSISANIDKELYEKLQYVSSSDERSKSYYIKKGLSYILEERIAELGDSKESEMRYKESIESGEKYISLDEVIRNIN